MSSSAPLLIGVDVGGTNLRMGVVSGLAVVEETRFHADFAGLCRNQPPDQALAAIHAVLAEALTAVVQQHADVAAIGLGFPGFIAAGRLLQSPNLPGLIDVDLATPLQQTLGLPVMVENDALAAAYGEYQLLKASAPNSAGGLVYLGLGTGVGGGLVTGGAPYAGEHGVAMEVGHIIVEPGGRPCGCGNQGCMEQYASASGISLSYLQATGRRLSAQQVAQQATAGDADAISAYALAGDKLAQALAHILKVADISNIVVGGGVSAAWPLLQVRFDARLEADLIPALRGKIRVFTSQAGDQAGILGAARLAARALSMHGK